jgi:hypothetical protein
MGKLMEGECNHQCDDSGNEGWNCEIEQHKLIDFPFSLLIAHVIIASTQMSYTCG